MELMQAKSHVTRSIAWLRLLSSVANFAFSHLSDLTAPVTGHNISTTNNSLPQPAAYPIPTRLRFSNSVSFRHMTATHDRLWPQEHHVQRLAS